MLRQLRQRPAAAPRGRLEQGLQQAVATAAPATRRAPLRDLGNRCGTRGDGRVHGPIRHGIAVADDIDLLLPAVREASAEAGVNVRVTEGVPCAISAAATDSGIGRAAGSR